MIGNSNVVASFAEAVRDIPDGATIAFAGFADIGMPANKVEQKTFDDMDHGLPDARVGARHERVEDRQAHGRDCRIDGLWTRATRPERWSTRPSGVSSRSAPSAANPRDPERS